MPSVAFLELLNRKSCSLQQLRDALSDERMKNIALSEHDALRTLQLWKKVTSCITGKGENELAPAAALQLSRNLLHELPDIAQYRNIWPNSLPILCEGMSACFALLRWNPTCEDCKEVVSMFVENIEAAMSSSPQFKSFCGPQMLDVLLTSARQAVTQGFDIKGSNFSKTAGSLRFCAHLLLKLVTKCPTNQQALFHHAHLEVLLRDMLPRAVTVDLQMLIVEILVRILRKNTLPHNLAAHILPIEDGIRNAITQKDIPLHLHMSNLVMALNKHNAQSKAASQVIQPHLQARLRRAQIRNSGITTKIPEGATIMFGGAKLALTLTFMLDTRCENDLCTLLKSDVKEVHYKATGGGDSATVTFQLGSVRSAWETNLCLHKAAQTVADGDTGLVLDLELSTQDAQLLHTELIGPRKVHQKNVLAGKAAEPDKKKRPGKHGPPTMKPPAARPPKDPIEGYGHLPHPQTQNRCRMASAKTIVHRAKLDMKPLHPRKPSNGAPMNVTAPTDQAQPSCEGTRVVMGQNLDLIDKQAMMDTRGQKTLHVNKAPRNRDAPSSATEALEHSMPAQPLNMKASSTAKPDMHILQLPAQLTPSPDQDPYHLTAEPISMSPAVCPQFEDAPPAQAQAEMIDALPPLVSTGHKSPPVRMQRRGKVNAASKSITAAIESKENENINENIRRSLRHVAARQDAGVKKPKATRRTSSVGQRAKLTSYDPIEACFDAPKASQKHIMHHKKTNHVLEVADVSGAPLEKSSQQTKRITVEETPNATAAVGRPERKALARNAKSNVKYDDCDASDDDVEDPFQPLKPRSKAPHQKVNNPSAGGAGALSQKQIVGKAKHAKSDNKGKSSRASPSPPESPAAKNGKCKEPVPLSSDVPAHADDGECPQVSLTAGVLTAPQNPSPGSLNQWDRLQAVPDSADTAGYAQKSQAKLGAAAPASKLNQPDERAPRAVAGKVVPSPLSAQAVANKLNNLTFSGLSLTDQQQAWQQTQVGMGHQGLSDSMMRSGGLTRYYSPLMEGNMSMPLGAIQFGQRSMPAIQMEGGFGFGGQAGFGAPQVFMHGPCSASGFTSQMGKPDALQSMAKVILKEPRSTSAAFQSVQQGAAAGKQRSAVPQLPGTVKRSRTPETGRKASNKKKKGRIEGDQEGKQARAIEQEIKQLMQVIDTLMKDEDAADDQHAMKHVQNALAKLMNKKQQLITNQKSRELEDGMEMIQANITEAEEQMIRQAQEMDASFEQALRESETELEGKWQEMAQMYDNFMKALQEAWREYQHLQQSQLDLLNIQTHQVEQFNQRCHQKFVKVKDTADKELGTLKASVQKEKKKASRKKGLQAAQQMAALLQNMH